MPLKFISHVYPSVKECWIFPGAGLALVTEESSSQFGGWSIAALTYPSDQGMPVLSGFQPLSGAHARWPQVAQL